MTRPAVTEQQSAKRVRYHACTILRTFKRSHFLLKLSSGSQEFVRAEVVTERCNHPLFGGAVQSGICDQCAKGWTHPDNTFASDEEKQRATAARSPA